MIKKITMVMLVVFAIVALAGCSKVVSTETFEAPVRIIDVDYDPAVVIPMKSGSVTIMQTTPADYDVVVEYAGIEYTIDSRDAYKAAENNVGSVMQAVIEKTRYDDGEVVFKVKDLVID